MTRAAPTCKNKGGADNAARMDDCYEPSFLVRWVHEEIPFIDIGFNNSGNDAEDLVDRLDQGVEKFYAYFLRAVVWGVIVALMGCPLLILTCVWHGCTACVCKGDDDRELVRYKVARVVCVALLLIQIILAICVIGVGLWVEEQFNQGFKGNIEEVQQFTQNATSMSDGVSMNSTLELLVSFGNSSRWIFICYFSFLFLPLLTTLLATVATTLCKHAVSMIVNITFLMITSACLPPIIGVATIFLIIYSDVCVGLQHKQLHDTTNKCNHDLTGYSGTLNKFCNDTYLSSVLMMAASAILGVIYVGLQLCGSCYAGIYAGYRRGTSKVADGHELQNLDSQTETADPPAQEETNENDTTVLLPAIETESQSSSTIAEDVRVFLSSQPINSPPSAPPLTSLQPPSSTIAPIPTTSPPTPPSTPPTHPPPPFSTLNQPLSSSAALSHPSLATPVPISTIPSSSTTQSIYPPPTSVHTTNGTTGESSVIEYGEETETV